MTLRLSTLVANLEADRDQLATDVDRLTQRVEQLLRDQVADVPAAAAREIYRRGYRAGYSSARRCTNKRGPYQRTRALTGDPA